VLISVAVRSLNEKELLSVFIENHQFADEIIVVDGGSTDGSRELVRGAPAISGVPVHLVDFTERVPGRKGGWRNPEGRHVNFALDQCKGEWIWLTEMDAIPSLALQKEVRGVLERGHINAVGSYLYYIAPRKEGEGYEHYPELIKGRGLTCWHRSLNLRADPDKDFEPTIKFEHPWYCFSPPAARVHLSWRSEEVLRAKWKFYREVHGLNQEHPDKKWDREPLPEWLEWKGK